MFKVNNKDTRMTSVSIYCELLTYCSNMTACFNQLNNSIFISYLRFPHFVNEVKLQVGRPSVRGQLTMFSDFSRKVVFSQIVNLSARDAQITIPHDFPIVNKNHMKVKINGRYFCPSFLVHNNVLIKTFMANLFKIKESLEIEKNSFKTCVEPSC